MSGMRCHFVDLLEMSNNVEAMCECPRAIRTAKMTNSSAFMTHVSDERVFDLIPEQRN